VLDDDARAALSALLSGRLDAWRGLPHLRVPDLALTFGPPRASRPVELGAYPALRIEVGVPGASRTLVAFARQDEVVMVAVEPPPDLSVLALLPPPTLILPQETDAQDAYLHEYLYKDRGLWLTVAERFDEAGPNELVRCRGIRPLAPSEHLSAELYLPLESREVW
jgi:hypothetical protein